MCAFAVSLDLITSQVPLWDEIVFTPHTLRHVNAFTPARLKQNHAITKYKFLTVGITSRTNLSSMNYSFPHDLLHFCVG